MFPSTLDPVQASALVCDDDDWSLDLDDLEPVV